jgi:uncharacterized protein YgiM (DUF1202 family)
MKTDRFSVLVSVALLLCGAGQAAENATVKADKVNVRGQATLKSETIVQLNKGEAVTILEEIQSKNPRKGEPKAWAKIQLPANTSVWVFAPLIEANNKTVNVTRVNLRGGPGENFSVLGRLERGAPVKEIRTVNNWMEIETPADAYAFVALDLLEKTAATAAVEPATTTQPEAAPVAAPVTPQPEPTPVTVQTVEPEAPIKVADDHAAATPAEAADQTPAVEVAAAPAPAEPTATSPATVAQVEPAPEPAPVIKRVVIREGRVVYSRSVQAPTKFALESLENHRLINYLHTEQIGRNLKAFAGRKVVVTGEELLDARWAYTPILDVEDISIAR